MCSSDLHCVNRRACGGRVQLYYGCIQHVSNRRRYRAGIYRLERVVFVPHARQAQNQNQSQTDKAKNQSESRRKYIGNLSEVCFDFGALQSAL